MCRINCSGGCPECDPDSHEQKARVENHIACEEQGYPQSEARFSSVKEWEDLHKKDWHKYLNF